MSNALEAASLIMVPSGYENGTLASVKPNDGTGDFTFSRGSNLSATRINEQGYIEKGYENLFLQSNSFDATWTTFGASVTSGQSGYDGSNDAWLLEKTSANGYLNQSNIDNGLQTFSIYAKANESNFLYVRIYADSPRVFFDLINGVTTNSGPVISSSIENVGNGWYRCSFSTNMTSASFLRIYPAEAAFDSSATSGSIYIQDAMLNQGLVAYPYIETTTTPVAGGILENMPRLDWASGAPSLLLEPSRTNLVKYSEYFEGTGWLMGANTEKVSSNNLSPSGELNAYKFKSINITGSTFVRFSAVVADNTDYTFSCYARSDNPSALTTGQLLQLQMSGGGQITSISSTLVTSEWKRFDITATSGTTSTAYCYLGTDYDVDAEIEFWGAQLEQGSYPTSYIPTYGVSQTRLRDSATTGDISSIVNSPEGTIFTEFSKIQDFSSFQLDDGNQNNRITLYPRNNTTQITFILTIGGVQQIRQDPSPDGLDTTQFNKYAIAWGLNDFRVYVNGVNIYSSASNITFGSGTLNDLDIVSANHKQFTIFPTAISDSECIQLTTI